MDRSVIELYNNSVALYEQTLAHYDSLTGMIRGALGRIALTSESAYIAEIERLQEQTAELQLKIEEWPSGRNAKIKRLSDIHAELSNRQLELQGESV